MTSTRSSSGDESFDFIIVGGGTAGLVLANRLTAEPQVSVLAIEAGSNRLQDPQITTPGLVTTLYNDPTYDWSFGTVPQEHLYGKKVSHSRVKVLGGSSADNVLALIYLSKSSIDAWGKFGNKGWDFDTLAPYYRKFYTFDRPSTETGEALVTDYIDGNISGKSGPIQSSFPEFHGPLGKAWPETFKNLNFAMTIDPLSGQSTGGFTYLSSIDPKSWERSHAGSAYYAPIATIDMIRDPAVIQGAMDAYERSRTGPLTSSFHSVASLHVVEFFSDEGQAELARLLDTHAQPRLPSQPASQGTQYAILRSILESPSDGSVTIGMGASQLHFHACLQKDIYAITDPANCISFLVAFAHHYSRGTVQIGSNSPSSPPEIDPRYPSHPLDPEILARHMCYVLTIAATKPLASLIEDGGKRLPDGVDISTLDAAKEHVKRKVITNNHPCGTCAMLPKENGGVVDERLKVHGVRNLRVVDASIFPMIPRGNIQKSVHAVAEREAELVEEDWK